MARTPRLRSTTGVYHVILRGNNRQVIFKDTQDYKMFLYVLKEYKAKIHFKIFAYCLMSNHIHLLIKEGDVGVDEMMKRIGIKYVKWYNKKYERCGYLFQNRYKSEPVEDEEYFKTVFRYIHQNPLHAKLEKTVGEYPWSSFWHYAGQLKSTLAETQEMFSYFGGEQALLEFLREDSKEVCMEDYNIKTLSDDEALKVVRIMSGCCSSEEFQKLMIEEKEIIISKLLSAGLAERQIVRLTGVSRRLVLGVKSIRVQGDRC